MIRSALVLGIFVFCTTASAQQISAPMAPQSSATAATPFTATNGANTAASAQQRAGHALNPIDDFGAPANTQRGLAYGVTSNAGSPSVTINLPFSNSDVGKNIVVAGIGPGVAQTAAVAAGGAGNAVGDLLTLSVGACATAPTLKVTAVSSGAVLVAVPWTPGLCSTAIASLPSTAVSVASTTGVGTGATFVITWAALPLKTTISAVSGTHILTLAANALQTLSSAANWVAWGNDDAPAINALLSTGVTAVSFPATATYGIFSPIVLPTNNRVDFQCNGATIVALAPMAEMLYEASPGNFFNTEGSTVENCRFDGMGQAALNVSHNAFSWSYRNNTLRNATTGNLYVGGYGENTMFSANQYYNDATVTAANPQYNVQVNYTDNHFTDEIASGAVNNFVDNTNGTYWTNVHGYYTLAEAFLLNGSFHASNIYADGIPSYTAGIKITGSSGVLNGWWAYVTSGTGQMGVWTANSTGNNVVINGYTGNNITTANIVVSTGATNTLFNNVSASSVSSLGGQTWLYPANDTSSVSLGAGAGRSQTTTSGSNLYLGNSACYDNQTGSENICIGASSGFQTTAGGSVYIGAFSGYNNGAGGGDVWIGVAAGQGSGYKTGGNDSGIGNHVLASITGSATQNTAFGSYTLQNLTSGSQNTAFGENVGPTLTNGSNNILIGTSSATDVAAGSNSNMLNIGGLFFGNTTNLSAPTVAGGTSPSIDVHANNHTGTATFGSGTVTSGNITFASAYSSWDHCRVTSQSALSNLAYSYTLSAITVTASSLTGAKIDYECEGY